MLFDRFKNKKIEIIFQTLNKINERLENQEKLLKYIFKINKLPEATGNLKLIQQASFSILVKFAKIAQQENLKWWLDSGTLIGYIRHSAFIPWDEDVDIAMMREDYNKLPQILEKHFKNSDFSFVVGDITRLYYKTLHVWVDIMPMDMGNSVVPLQGKDYLNFVKILDDIKSSVKFDYHKWLEHKNPVSNTYLRYCFLRRDNELVKQKVKNGFLFYGVETRFKNRTLFPYNWIFPLKKINFLGLESFIPNNSDMYLISIYGDYMAWPKDFSSVHGTTFIQNMTVEDIKNYKELIENYYPKEN